MRRKMKKGAQVQAPTIERNVTPPPTPCGNMPLIQEPVGGTVMLPNTSSFTVVGNGMPMGLAQYSQVDEYGRVFTPIMLYWASAQQFARAYRPSGKDRSTYPCGYAFSSCALRYSKSRALSI